jgi:hypothetical protein
MLPVNPWSPSAGWNITRLESLSTLQLVLQLTVKTWLLVKLLNLNTESGLTWIVPWASGGHKSVS